MQCLPLPSRRPRPRPASRRRPKRNRQRLRQRRNPRRKRRGRALKAEPSVASFLVEGDCPRLRTTPCVRAPHCAPYSPPVGARNLRYSPAGGIQVTLGYSPQPRSRALRHGPYSNEFKGGSLMDLVKSVSAFLAASIASVALADAVDDSAPLMCKANETHDCLAGVAACKTLDPTSSPLEGGKDHHFTIDFAKKVVHSI